MTKEMTTLLNNTEARFPVPESREHINWQYLMEVYRAVPILSEEAVKVRLIGPRNFPRRCDRYSKCPQTDAGHGLNCS